VTYRRTAVVTGAGTGIGESTAELLAYQGLDVALVGRSYDSLHAVAERISGAGGRALVVQVDLRTSEGPSEVVAQVVEFFGRLDVIVNNAAFIRTGPIDTVTAELIDEHYALNVRAPLLLLKAALEALRVSPDAGIVNISSSVGSMLKPGTMLYGSSKASLEYLTRAWAYELAPDGIRVNCIAPGPVDTPIHATYSDDLEATYADLARRIPLGRIGQPRDIAAWVWHLVGPDSGWTTGNILHIDGGQVLGLPESAGG
jgi:NAD(P)-dependent dehydrogenase (short-subunit alcohol dehydrogenase family)